MFRRLIPLLLVLLITPFTLIAQENADHPPQFLYRDGNHLVLVSILGETSETITLPNITTGNEWERFEWSPDGRYLLTLLVPNDAIYLSCMNLYDVDNLQWL